MRADLLGQIEALKLEQENAAVASGAADERVEAARAQAEAAAEQQLAAAERIERAVVRADERVGRLRQRLTPSCAAGRD